MINGHTHLARHDGLWGVRNREGFDRSASASGFRTIPNEPVPPFPIGSRRITGEER